MGRPYLDREEVLRTIISFLKDECPRMFSVRRLEAELKVSRPVIIESLNLLNEEENWKGVILEDGKYGYDKKYRVEKKKVYPTQKKIIRLSEEGLKPLTISQRLGIPVKWVRETIEVHCE